MTNSLEIKNIEEVHNKLNNPKLSEKVGFFRDFFIDKFFSI